MITFAVTCRGCGTDNSDSLGDGLMHGNAGFHTPEKGFQWTAKKQRAAVLLAEDDRFDADIAAELGIHPTTLWRWRQDPDFAGAVADHVGRLQASMVRLAIARKFKRLQVLDGLHTALLTVIDERGSDMVGEAPGGATGLLVRQTKVIGSGPNAETVTEYTVDVGLVREIRAVEQQAATELGQWLDKSQVENVTQVVEIVGVPRDAI